MEKAKKWFLKNKFLLIKLFLFFIIIIAIYSLILSLINIDEMSERLNIIAGSLSVITAVISAFLAAQIFQNKEEEEQPRVYPGFDVTSRYMLAQLFVENSGGSTAYNIDIDWDTPLTNSEGNKVKFNENDDKPEVLTLLPNQRVSVMIDTTIDIFKDEDKDLNYSGTIIYEDSNGVEYKDSFQISLEKFSKNLAHPHEKFKTYYDLQKIPDELNKIQKELNKITGNKSSKKQNSRDFMKLLVSENRNEFRKIKLETEIEPSKMRDLIEIKKKENKSYSEIIEEAINILLEKKE